MVERRGHGRGEADKELGRDATRGERFAAVGEPLLALRCAAELRTEHALRWKGADHDLKVCSERSCMRDEGRSRKAWPLGVGYQEQAPNHSKLLRSRVVVVSVGVKTLDSSGVGVV